MILSEQVKEYVSLGREVASHYSPTTFAFVSGSLIEGFGNSRSDLDVFVVSPAALAVSPGEAMSFGLDETRVDITYSTGLRADTEVWQLETIGAVAAELKGIALADRAAMTCMQMNRLELAHSLRIGLPVQGEHAFEDMRDRFDFAKLAYVLAANFLARYQASAEDAAGAVLGGDGGSALLTSRDALGGAIDFYLASCGDTNPKPKWRTRKLRRLCKEEMLNEYLSHEAQEGVDERSLLQAAKRRLRFANNIAQLAQENLAKFDSSMPGDL